MKILAALLALLAIFSAGNQVLGQSTTDRIAVLTDYHGYFPCNDCHGDQETVHQPRVLEEEHFEPIEWEDDEGVTHLVPLGQRISIAELLGQTDRRDIRSENLTRIGQRIGIEAYMEANGLAAEDSVWTLLHGGGNLWCLNCHNADDRDRLVKLNGELLTFNQSQLLCGECHGPKLLDWERGIHGKTTGYWDGARDVDEISERRLCVECHSPHAPAFPAMEPLAGPILRLDPPGSEHRNHQPSAADPNTH